MKTGKRVMNLALIAVISLSAACVNKPNVSDMTYLTTFDIVERVLCEAKPEVQQYYNENNFKNDSQKLTKLNKRKKFLKSRIARDKSGIQELSDTLADLKADLNRNRRKLFRIKRNYLASQQRFDEQQIAIQQIIDAIEKADDLQTIETLEKEAKIREKELILLSRSVTDSEREFKRLDRIRTIIVGEIKDLANGLKPHENDKKELSAINKTISEKFKKFGEFNSTVMTTTFNFEITENNNATLGSEITWPIHNGTFKLTNDLGNKRTRASDRDVLIATKFSEIEKLNCLPSNYDLASNTPKNYPITGYIGVDEVVRQYFELAKVNLTRTSAETYTDKIAFTTTLNAGIKPSVSLSPTSPSIVQVNGDLNADRKDLHEVTVAIAVVSPGAAKSSSSSSNINIERVPEIDIRLIEDSDGSASKISILSDQ